MSATGIGDLSVLVEHAATLELPQASVKERAQLLQSIPEQGVLVPIIVSAGTAHAGQIADGQERAAICAQLELDSPREEQPFRSEAEFRAFPRHLLPPDRGRVPRRRAADAGRHLLRAEYLCEFQDAIDAVFAHADVIAALDESIEPLSAEAW